MKQKPLEMGKKIAVFDQNNSGQQVFKSCLALLRRERWHLDWDAEVVCAQLVINLLQHCSGNQSGFRHEDPQTLT